MGSGLWWQGGSGLSAHHTHGEQQHAPRDIERAEDDLGGDAEAEPPVELLEQLRVRVERIEGSSDTLPPPEMLDQYDSIVPGAAERIIDMAERQAAHRRSLEKRVVEGGSRRATAGLWLGSLIAIVGLAASFVLAMNGRELAAGLIGVGDVALVAVFVFGRAEQRLERLERARVLPH